MTALNDSQKRAILFGFLDLHRRLADLESLLAQSVQPAPLFPCVDDLGPQEMAWLRSRFAQVRAAMLSFLEEAGIPLDMPRAGLRWSVQCGMDFLSIGIAELGPERLRGYGPLSEEGQNYIEEVQGKLNRLVDEIRAGLRHKHGFNASPAG